MTQRFDTTTSMGRLMLNILLSFAQFEREIIGERIRDKVAATKRKGKYTGGPPVLGYDVDRERKRLVVNPEQAALVRTDLLPLRRRPAPPRVLAQELNAQGHTTKSWTTKKGVVRAGPPWHKGLLYRVLNNPLYLGEVDAQEASATPESTRRSSPRSCGIRPMPSWSGTTAPAAHRRGRRPRPC